MSVIYIPTWGRVDRQITWESFDEVTKHDSGAVLVAHPSEADALRSKGYPVLETPEDVTTIGVKRQWIFDQHNVRMWGPWAVIIDDDLRFAKRREDDPTKFIGTNDIPGEFGRMIDNLFGLFMLSPLVGIRNRSGANRDHDGGLFLKNRRQFDVIGVDVQVMRKHNFRLDRTPIMEDFDFVLQFLTAGYSNLLLNTHTEDDMSGRDSAGGCQDERTALAQFEAAHWLAETWPDFVKVEEKRTKGEGAWSVRTDVRVQWAKAAEYGKKMRA